MSIEEDVKRCKELIKIEHANWIGMSNQSAISNVLAEREQDKKRIKQLEKENGELRERVKELDKENDELLKDLYSANCIIADLTDSIPKQKIKDKMKKYEWAMKHYDSSIADYKQSQAVGRWIALQELLQESEGK